MPKPQSPGPDCISVDDVEESSPGELAASRAEHIDGCDFCRALIAGMTPGAERAANLHKQRQSLEATARAKLAEGRKRRPKL